MDREPDEPSLHDTARPNVPCSIGSTVKGPVIYTVSNAHLPVPELPRSRSTFGVFVRSILTIFVRSTLILAIIATGAFFVA